MRLHGYALNDPAVVAALETSDDPSRWRGIRRAYPDWHNRTTGSWHAARETSREVAAAIWHVAALHGVPPADIWEDPSDTRDEVVQVAWLLAEDDADALYWGGDAAIRRDVF